jgi:hypothetical protein
MPLIAMNREWVARRTLPGLADRLGIKVQHHEMIDHLADAPGSARAMSSAS